MSAWERATQLWHDAGLEIVIGGVIFIASLAFSAVLVTYVLVNLPASYLYEDVKEGPWWVRKSPGAIVARTVVGVIVILIGIVLSLPGVPGQGLLTILIGLILLEFPGKTRLERRLMRGPRMLRTINRIRRRFRVRPLGLIDPSLEPDLSPPGEADRGLDSPSSGSEPAKGDAVARTETR